MPWSGAGVFNRIFSWTADAAAGIDISSSRMDTDTNDITTNGFGNTLTRDGQGSATANQPMNGFHHTGASNGVADTDYTTVGQMKGATGSFPFVNVAATNLSASAAFTAVNATITTLTATSILGNPNTTANTLTAIGAVNFTSTFHVGQAVQLDQSVTILGTLNVVQTGNMVLQPSTAPNGFAWIVFDSGASSIGSITSNLGTGTSYNTSSDYRLKVTFGEADTGAMIDAVTVYDAEFIAAPGKRSQMFLAHELAEIAPFAVTGEKDAVDAKGEIVPQMVDASKLVPALWAELKSLRRRVAALEARQ